MYDLSKYPEVISEYDDILVGAKHSFSGNVFHKDGQFNERNALIILQYAFVYYLKWTPEAVANTMTKKLMTKMHLDQVMNYVKFPIEYDNKNDYYYLATLIFPQFGLSLYDRTVHIYERILNGELSKFPKNYFFGSDGAVRAGICLQYMINHYITFHSMNELYHIFGTDTGYKFLKDYKLLAAYKDAFETPVDYLHFSLPDDQKDAFFFYFYKFKFLTEMLDESGRKQHTEAEFLLVKDKPEEMTLECIEREERKEERKRKEEKMKPQVLKAFKKILDNPKAVLRPDFFGRDSGRISAEICLRYMLQNYVDVKDTNELYSMFSYCGIWKWLEQYQLDKACRLYETPVDYLHASLKEYGDRLSYWFYKFVYIYFSREIQEAGLVKKEEEDVQEEDVQEEDAAGMECMTENAREEAVQKENAEEEAVQEEDVQKNAVHDEELNEENTQEEDMQKESIFVGDVQIRELHGRENQTVLDMEKWKTAEDDIR